MTEDEFDRLVSTGTAAEVLSTLADVPDNQRRKFAKAASRLFRTTVMVWLNDRDGPAAVDEDAARVAFLATASLGELKKVTFHAIPRDLAIDEVLSALSPPWIQEWVEALVADNPHIVERLAPLWRKGLCRRPSGDAIILGYYVPSAWRMDDIEERELLDGDIWRFFEVEGGGEFSLAAHDKYAKSADNCWQTRLLDYAARGKLPRVGLLDGSLDALKRDFGQFRAGWYSRLHTALDPTMEEMSTRSTSYLHLLASTVPPTVSFAMKAVQKLYKSGRIAPVDLVESLDAPLQARQKSTATAALKLLHAAAIQEPALVETAGRKATLALIAEQVDVQSGVLDLIEQLGAAKSPDIRAELAHYLDHVAPSLRARLASLADMEMSPETNVVPIVTESTIVAVEPVACPEDALALFLAVIENPRDPIEIERAMDGLARFGSALRTDSKTLSPLLKRAEQISDAPGDSEIRLVLAITGHALAQGRPIDRQDRLRLRSDNFSCVCFDRNAEIVRLALDGRTLPMLSTPSANSGCIDPTGLIERLANYRTAGAEPGDTDMALALLRLDRQGRSRALQNFHPNGDAELALAYALGGDVEPGRNRALWCSAWAARLPADSDPRIIELCGTRQPDCGVPAVLDLQVQRRQSEGYSWTVVKVAVDPPPSDRSAETIATRFFPASPNKMWQTTTCGSVYADVAWASLIRPGAPEAFFRQALLQMDTCEKLSEHPGRAYIEHFFRPGDAVGPLGAATLAYFLASEDKSVTSLAVDAVIHTASSGRLAAKNFAPALKPFLMSGTLPTKRWTNGFAAISEAGPASASFVRETITSLLTFGPDDAPRDIGGMLELLFELHTASNSVPKDPSLLACLRSMKGGGKTARYSKALLKLAG